MNEDSIYTTQQTNSTTTSTSTSTSLRYKRKDQIQDGPWYMNLKNVIERKSLSEEKRILRNQRKRGLRKIRNEKKKKKLKIERREEEEEEEEEEKRSSVGSDVVENQKERKETNEKIDEERRTVNFKKSDQKESSFPEELKDLLPCSSLLTSIHETVSKFYTNQNLMKPKPINRLGRKPKKPKPEPKLMLKSLHGSALISLGILIEEMVKEEISKLD
ncbi:hypothetical protein DFH28DRAFT_1105208 [Melampsora americana]|nr:hypothetical protein DFH28DRAFT_1105208 [Melampsora americana]